MTMSWQPSPLVAAVLQLLALQLLSPSAAFVCDRCESQIFTESGTLSLPGGSSVFAVAVGGGAGGGKLGGGCSGVAASGMIMLAGATTPVAVGAGGTGYRTMGTVGYNGGDNNLADDVEALNGRRLELLQKDSSDVITAMVQKFQENADDFEFPVLNESDRIIVLADEAHRTQYGSLGAAIQTALPNAPKIAFTGTPLIKSQKTSNVFGSYIDTYTIEQAVKDGATVQILYEGREAQVKVTGSHGRSCTCRPLSPGDHCLHFSWLLLSHQGCGKRHCSWVSQQ